MVGFSGAMLVKLLVVDDPSGFTVLLRLNQHWADRSGLLTYGYTPTHPFLDIGKYVFIDRVLEVQWYWNCPMIRRQFGTRVNVNADRGARHEWYLLMRAIVENTGLVVVLDPILQC